jgi:hypothetical protein
MSDVPAVDYEVSPVEGTEEIAEGTPRFTIHLRQGEVVGHVIAWTATELEARYIVSACRRPGTPLCGTHWTAMTGEARSRPAFDPADIEAAFSNSNEAWDTFQL